MIEWVWRGVSSLDVFSEVVVAVDDAEVLRAVERFGGRAVLTRAEHVSGTDRVAEVAERPEFSAYGTVVNLQGDEPFLPHAAAEEAVRLVEAGWDIGTAAVPVASVAEWDDPSTVKVVRDDRGGALYFSRAAIPHGGTIAPGLDAAESTPLLRHVGVYAFSRSALRRATSLPRHRLEEMEGLEQLRWLAAGLRIGVAIVSGGSPGIDTEEDVVRAQGILKGRQ